MTPDQISALPYRPCVGVMLANPEGKIWVGQRIDTELQAWQMPQGGIDPGEEPRGAALRELQEETGILPASVAVEAESQSLLRYDLPHDLVPKIWKGRFRGQEQRWFLMRFRGADDQIIIETRHPEFSRWTWLDPDDLVEKIVPFKRDVYAQVVAEFRDRL